LLAALGPPPLKHQEARGRLRRANDFRLLRPPASDLGRGAAKGSPQPTKEIETSLDSIFAQLSYVDGEYPFEHSWRRDGVTAAMVVRYCEINKLKCYVHHRSGLIATHLPDGATSATPTIHFSIFGNHAYCFSKSIDDRGGERDNHANLAASKQRLREEEHVDSDSFTDKKISPLCASSLSPGYEEWDCMESLTVALSNGDEDRYRHAAAALAGTTSNKNIIQ
jgi:hypothetical protein